MNAPTRSRTGTPSRLARQLERRLGCTAVVAEGGSPVAATGDDVVVLVRDGLCTPSFTHAAAAARRSGRSVVAIHLDPGALVVGPFVSPTRPGCVTCCAVRTRAAQEHPREQERLRTDHPAELDAMARPLAGTVLADLAAAVVDDEVAGAGRLDRGFVRIDLLSGATSLHHFLADPLCEVCATPLPSAEPPMLTLEPRTKATPEGFRTSLLHERRDELLRHYVDPRAGLVHRLFRDSGGLFPVTHGKVGHRIGHSHQLSLGRQLDFGSCDLTAVTEGLERYAGMQNRSETAVRGSFADLQPDAVDPRDFGLHDPAQYAMPGFPFQPFGPDVVVDWVPAHSFRRGRTVLVPATYAYYEWLYQAGRDRPFAYEISNGCAIGSSIQEAVIHGIFELVERDAFLMTWYARLPVPRIRPTDLRDPSVALMVQHIRHRTGYGVHIFDTTMEHGVPAVWAMAVDELERPNTPRILCAGGGHLDPERAVKDALLELAPFTKSFPPAYLAHRERIRAMVDDPYEVHTMDDHRLLYCAPEAADRMTFLLDQTSQFTVPRDRFAAFYARPRHSDLTDDMHDLVARYLDRGLDVLVCDQTRPELRAGGLHCAKVMIPGLLPMTFGHYARRMSGLPRLSRVPVELGYATVELEAADLCVDPHPFP